MDACLRDTIYDYLTAEEAEACAAYRKTYAAAYVRLHDRETDDLRLLRYWRIWRTLPP